VTADAAGVVFTARTVSGTWQVASVSRNGDTVTPLVTSTVDQPLRDVAIVGANATWIDRNMIKRVSRGGIGEATVNTYTSLRRRRKLHLLVESWRRQHAWANRADCARVNCR
jgi:hypothetical protein